MAVVRQSSATVEAAPNFSGSQHLGRPLTTHSTALSAKAANAACGKALLVSWPGCWPQSLSNGDALALRGTTLRDERNQCNGSGYNPLTRSRLLGLEFKMPMPGPCCSGSTVASSPKVGWIWRRVRRTHGVTVLISKPRSTS